MGALDGRVAIVTGAGRGIGREHALLFAREGASVVVNDTGGTPDGGPPANKGVAGGGGDNAGEGSDSGPAHDVVAEIEELGGRAVANTDDVASWSGAEALVAQAVEEFGRLDVLVNNAGILRDAFVPSMDEAQWDAVINVHLKGHFAALHHASVHWKAQSKAGAEVKASVVNTASASGTFLPNPGQANYGAAKAGIAAISLVAAAELSRYGVRVNAIAPIARTRLTLATPGMGAIFAQPVADGEFDAFSPANISPLVAYLASERCTVTGKVFAVQGGNIAELVNWHMGSSIETDKPWTIDEIEAGIAGW